MAIKLPVAAAALALLSPVLGQTWVCEGLYRPDYDACDRIVQGWEGDYIDGLENTSEEAGTCHFRYHTDGNCIIGACFNEDGPRSVSFGMLYSSYEHRIKYNCKPVDSGGHVPFDVYDVLVRNNEDYTGGSRASLVAATQSYKLLGDGVEEFTISREAFEDLYKGMPEDASEKPAKKTRSRIRGSHVHKRQEDGDDFTLLEAYKSVTRSGDRHQASSILSPGTEETWSFSETITVSTTTSAEVGVSLWEIFSASAGVETTQEESHTVESGLSFTVGNCDNEGVVYWYPLYDHYIGYWSSDPDTDWEVWIPLAQGDHAAGRFQTVCLG